jgi:hypothetical protein
MIAAADDAHAGAEQSMLAYVRASAQAIGLPLDVVRAQAVAVHMGRTAALAQLLESAALSPEHEPAEVYCPAPFPDRGGA